MHDTSHLSDLRVLFLHTFIVFIDWNICIDAQELANLSTLELINNDGSPSSQKLFALWNPTSYPETVGAVLFFLFSVSVKDMHNNMLFIYCSLALPNYRCQTKMAVTLQIKGQGDSWLDLYACEVYIMFLCCQHDIDNMSVMS